MSTVGSMEERAAAWLLRREEAAWSSADEKELQDWLAVSSLNRVTYYRLEHGWRQTDRLAALKPERASEADRSRRWLGVVLGTAVLGMLLTVGIALRWPDLSRPTLRTDTTQIGARSTVPLEDGTRVELNTDSLLKTEITAVARRAWLDRGEAYFDVAQDRSRPFVIHVASRQITVLGTRFSVRREDRQLEVCVLDGRVGLAGARSTAVVAMAGDRVVADGNRLLLEHGSPQRCLEKLSWRQGMVSFDGASLSEAAREFGRYNRKKIVVDPAAADAVHIGGTFDTNNIDAFARLLRDAYHLKVEDDGVVIRVSGKRPSP